MDIAVYFSKIGTLGIRALALRAQTSPIYLLHIRSGFRKASPKLARRIAEASAGNLSLHDIRPDIWKRGSK